MTVLFVGLSHATAPLAVIERLGFSADAAAATLACITPGDRTPTLPLRELVIVSTCHRVEMYGVPADEVTRPSVALDAIRSSSMKTTRLSAAAINRSPTTTGAWAIGSSTSIRGTLSRPEIGSSCTISPAFVAITMRPR